MKSSENLLAFLEKLAILIKDCEKLNKKSDYAPVLNKLIQEITPILPALKQEAEQLNQQGKQGWIKLAQSGKIPFGPGPVIPLAYLILEALLKCGLTPSQLANSIHAVFYYSIVLIEDYYQCKTYAATTPSYNVTNPDAYFWFNRVDVQGTHQYNTGGNYLVNTIPAIPDNSQYYNAEVYNSPYTSLTPSNVIADTTSLEVISDEIELYNFIYDLFINIPFCAAHNIVFTANIKADNLIGGSRGWGFWNTNAIPVIGMKVAWFLQQSDGTTTNPNNGFFAQTFNGMSMDTFKLPDLDENWHEYKIVLNTSVVEYYIDGNLVHSVSGEGKIPDEPLSFHNWVDNALFDFTGGGNKILQKTTAPRSNTTQTMTIATV